MPGTAQRRRGALIDRPADEGDSILVATLRAAPRLVAERGVDVAAVARRCGLDLRVLEDPENRIPFSLLGRFIAACADATRCDHLGLLIGAEEGVDALGVVGHLARHSHDVGSALRNVSSFLHHQEVGGVATLTVERGIAVFDYSIELEGLRAGDQIADGAMAITTRLLQFLCGPKWTPREVHLMHKRPRDTAPFRRILGPVVRFGAERNAVMFAAAWLDHRIDAADAGMRAIVQDRIRALEADHRAPLPARLRGIIRAMLLTGESSSEDAARRLAITRRTLHRRLAALGTTFEQLLDRVRFDLARQLLEHSMATMAEIAVALDYANASAFTRAFRRWSGTSPRAWRARHRPVPA